ncbi:MAG TPA: T9SS type A sorting domain-containing protein [Flavobacteriales bacterium]|nr:T9SS type A sorting domain-containing protein [Flavobacteriales bacterium]
MLNRLYIGSLFILCGTAVFGQGEVLRPLSTRPNGEEVHPKDNIDRAFVYQYETQDIPLMDDFSIDRTRKRNAREGDADVTLDDVVYRLEVGGVSTWDMLYSTDTTFRYIIDDADPPVTTRVPLQSVMVTVRDLSVLPPTSEIVEAWPAYNLRDSVTAPPVDTIHLTSPSLFQDSLLVYTVAPAGGTYEMNDVETPLILWQDDDVYINGTYPVEPPTIGVATFDGLSRTGYPYDFGNYSAHGIADRLTSVPIDLEYPASDSIYLSFFYQTKGLSGDSIGQVIDSLVLEFYAPLEQSWYRIWDLPYVDQGAFEQVLIPIREERFLKDGFQFRFANYATLSGSFDHWHLDYVRLAGQRTFDDTRLVDIAYMYPEASILQTYTSVPFARFEDATASAMALQVEEKMRNLDIEPAFINYGMSAVSQDGGALSNFTNGLSPSGNAASIVNTTHPINSSPNNFVYDNSVSEDAAFWDVKFWLNATPDINRYNDTIRLVQELSNYYAYDDGSAEAGYGLTSNNAKLAYRFDLIGPDSLRAIRMYFNPIANLPPAQQPLQGSFKLTVWTSLSPEIAIHTNYSFSSPEYRTDGVNKFVEYPLDSVLPVEGTIYIGWTQANATSVNIGFDRNRNNRTKIFYKTGSSFTNTSFNGSLMMRPVFVAGADPFAGVEDFSRTGEGLVLYPNPANDAVLLRLTKGAPVNATVECMDATGRTVLRSAYSESGPLSTSSLATGLYLVRVNDASGATLAQGRLVVQR